VRRSAARALGRRRDASAVSSLRRALSDSDGSVRQEAWASLGRLAKSLGKDGEGLALQEGRRALEHAVRSGMLEEQIVARTTLAALGESEQRAAVRKLAESSDVQARELVAQHAKSDPELLRKLLGDRVFAVRFAAAQRLAEQGDRSALDVLREGLAKTGSEGLRSYLLLRRLGETVAAPQEPRVILSRGSVEDRIQLVRLAASLPEDAAAATLAQAARDRDLGVRRAVVETAEVLALGESRAAAREALSILASDGSRSLRARAAMLLSSLPVESAPDKETADGPEGGSHVGATKTDGGADAGTPEAQAAVDGGTASAHPADAAEPGEGEDQGRSGEALAEDGAAASAASDRKLKAAEGYLQSGEQAAARADYKRAIKLLSRAAGSCSRSQHSARSQGCARVIYEAAYRMGSIYGAQSRWADAATEYERARQLQSRGVLSAHSQDIARALGELKGKLGSVLVLSDHNGRCRKRVQWLPPGRHMVKIGKETRLVMVSVGQQTEVGQCP